VRIVILTQYYPPETGAPQNRLSSLAGYLASYGNNVEILTAMPSYPKSEIFDGYKGKKYYKETIANITVHRSSIYVSKKSGITRRLSNYFSFCFIDFLRLFTKRTYNYKSKSAESLSERNEIL